MFTTMGQGESEEENVQKSNAANRARSLPEHLRAHPSGGRFDDRGWYLRADWYSGQR